jgi:hypothetical protein
MLRNAASKVMWVGRATVFLVGLAVILALVFGVATTALGANGQPFFLGKRNVASAISTLVKQGAGPALRLQVGAGQPPLAVDSSGKVANLNADQLDGKSDTDFYAAGSKVSDSSHADAAEVAATAKEADHATEADLAQKADSAGDADTLDGEDSAFFLHKPVVRAEGLASYQSVPNSAPFNGNPVRLQFPTEHFDTDDMHSTTQDTERFTATGAGYYWVSAGVEWNFSQNDSGGTRTLQIEYQPSNGNSRAYHVSEIPGSTQPIVQQGGQLLHLNVGDSVYARVFQRSGNTLEAHGTFFDAFWVGP